MYAVVEAVETGGEDECYFVGLRVGECRRGEVGEEGGAGLDHGGVDPFVERAFEMRCEF